MITYIITTHPHMTGVALSKAGEWGDRRFDGDVEAAGAARDDARGREYTIRRETVGARR